MTHFIQDLTYTSYKYEKKINKLIEPIKQLGATYFATQRVTMSGQWSILSSNPAWIDYSASNQLYLYDPSLINPKNYSSSIFFVGSHEHDDFRNIFCKHAEGIWDLTHTLAIIEKSENYCDFTFIATSAENKKIVNVYLNKLNYIRRFCDYFKNEHNHLFKNSLEYTVDIKSINNAYDATDNILNVESAGFAESSVIDKTPFNVLSPREADCVQCYLQGKTAKETAYHLGLSFRTVEEYFANIKKKLGCKNKREVLRKFMD